MKIIQFTEAFITGGAERMCVNISNGLIKESHEVMIICLTGDGPLEKFVDKGIKIVKLYRNRRYDFLALYRLLKIIKKFKPVVIQAHSTAIYWVAAIHFMFPKVKVIWHDHCGTSEFLDQRIAERRVLKLMRKAINGVVVCNNLLHDWNVNVIGFNANRVLFLNNFPELVLDNGWVDDLPGHKNTRIVLLANFRPQKAHEFFLEIAKSILQKFHELHFLLLGVNFNDTYFKKIEDYIYKNHLGNNIHILGTRTDIGDILANSSIGILTSKSEGLPVALLEYGLSRLPVVCTDVGECNKVLDGVGFCVKFGDKEKYIESLKELIQNGNLREQMGNIFFKRVIEEYSRDSFIKYLINFYETL